ncbi:MAG: homoserine dehydrogenase [bacterium]
MHSSTPIYIALLGLGHVGQGVLRILQDRFEPLSERMGRPVILRYVLVRDLSKYAKIHFNDATLVSDFSIILHDPDISIVVELIGGEFPAYDYITTSLMNKKHVITANKEVMAKHQSEFFSLAKTHKVDICFEAAVAGGIPIIRALKVGFAANKINSLHGILNGTTNYILSKIQADQLPFSEVLKEAQRLGLAEADPSMDVSGLDAAYKLVLLAGVAFKRLISLEDVYYEGIEDISLEDIRFAQELGYDIKLLAIGKHFEDKGYSFKVHPTLIPHSHSLCGIKDESNAVFVYGDAVGESLLAGKGAGGAPTASAVVSDLIDLIFEIDQPRSLRNLDTELIPCECLAMDQSFSQFYLRLLVKDEAGSLESVSRALRDSNLSISSVLQKEASDTTASLIIVTHTCFESEFNTAKAAIEGLDCVLNLASVIRVRLDEDD